MISIVVLTTLTCFLLPWLVDSQVFICTAHRHLSFKMSEVYFIIFPINLVSHFFSAIITGTLCIVARACNMIVIIDSRILSSTLPFLLPHI